MLETKGKVSREWRRHPRGVDASNLVCGPHNVVGQRERERNQKREREEESERVR
jgi:hypothetical protein